MKKLAKTTSKGVPIEEREPASRIPDPPSLNSDGVTEHSYGCRYALDAPSEEVVIFLMKLVKHQMDTKDITFSDLAKHCEVSEGKVRMLFKQKSVEEYMLFDRVLDELGLTLSSVGFKPDAR